MKKTYKIEVDCANCANMMEDAAKKTAGVKNCTVNFMMLKMIVEFDEGQDPKAVMPEVLKACKKVEHKHRKLDKVKCQKNEECCKWWKKTKPKKNN